ncbi:37s ribosomal protein rsm22 [Colletotrichum musicola]|uniref:37s ribosomal protein rsm22 n=1 Tax=Colletotrichum musicola TaxID=2175873 RepID=A0A8H6IRW2_9PEZI|nr:37s ribosomal protein rsm22 [Colletotrichum musicola]
MRLINVKTGKLEEFHEKIPSYAILSHTWGPDHEEISFRDAQEGHTSKPGFGKVKFDGCCRQAKVDGLDYAWIDTCCIDKTNAVELSEAINSMFRWYQMADKCYAILADVSEEAGAVFHVEFRASRWFERGWTLQELVAPKELVFYNKWKSLGSKHQLAGVVAEVTGIPRPYLLGIAKLQDASVAQRMSWAANRTTKRREDMAYSLLGIFNVMIPMIYGEGDMAFIRLGKPRNEGKHIIGNALASSPANFAGSGMVVCGADYVPTIAVIGVSRGYLHARLPLHSAEDGQTYGLLNCRSGDDRKAVVGIPLCCVTPGDDSDEFMRPAGSKAIMIVGSDPARKPRPVRIHESFRYEDAPNYNRRYGFYIEVPSSRELDIIDVYPKERWESKTSFVFTGVDFSRDSAQRTWIKVRHTPSSSKDFVVSLALEVKESKPQARCHLMVASRDTTLGRIDEMQQSPDVVKHLLSQQAAGNRSVGLQVTLTEERLSADLIFVVRLAETVEPPEVTVDADAEMELMQYGTCLQKLFKEERHARPKLEAFSEIAQGKKAEIAHIEEMIQQVKRELREKEEKRQRLSHQLAGKREELDILTHDNASFRGLDEDIDKMVTKSRGLCAAFGEQRFSAWLDSMLDHLTETLRCDGLLRVNSMPDKTQRVFMKAVAHGNVAAMSFLRDHLNRLDFENNDGHDILCNAVCGKHLSTIRWVIENLRPDINHLDSFDHSALHQAAWQGFTEAARLLLGHGASVDLQTSWGRSSLHLAAGTRGNVETVRLLLDQGADIRKCSKDGSTPLSIAAWEGHVPIVELLLERGALTLATGTDGATPLWAAAGRGNVEVALLLLRHGSDIQAKTRDGDMALHAAAQQGYAKMVELLLDRGADIESTRKGGAMPLMVAAVNGRDDIVAMLLERGAALEPKDENGHTAILYAVCCEQKSGVLGLLIDHGADMNALDHHNWTPLDFAVGRGQSDAVRQLIERGADVSLETRAGETALQHAQALSKTLADEKKGAMLEIIKTLQAAVTARQKPPPPSSVEPRRKSKKSKRP